MKMMRCVVLSLVMVLLSAPVIHGQDLSKYRNLSLGMSLVELSNQVDLKPLQTKLIHKHLAVIQELTWWPRESSGPSLQAHTFSQLSFTFYHAQLSPTFVPYPRL